MRGKDNGSIALEGVLEDAVSTSMFLFGRLVDAKSFVNLQEIYARSVQP